MERPWFGTLFDAWPEAVQALERIPSYRVLLHRGLDPHTTLLCVPPRKPGMVELFVLAQMFWWDAKSPVHWLLTTIGLSAHAQSVDDKPFGFSRFELVMAMRPGKEEPFPEGLGVVLSAPGATLPGFDWGQVRIPNVVRWLVFAADAIHSLQNKDSQFGITDTIGIGPGGTDYISTSKLDCSVLLPATVHMLLKGHGPFNDVTDPRDTVHPGEWIDDPGTERFTHGFYWLCPVSRAEHGRAKRDGTMTVFDDLVARSPKEADDACYFAFDLLREST